jgi:hypothetical protein
MGFVSDKRPDYTGKIWEVPENWISWSAYEVLSVNTEQRMIFFLTKQGNRYAASFDEMWRNPNAPVTQNSISPDKIKLLRLAMVHAVEDYPTQLGLAFSTGGVELSPLVAQIQAAQRQYLYGSSDATTTDADAKTSGGDDDDDEEDETDTASKGTAATKK